MIADGGGLVAASLHPIEGAEQIARYAIDLAVRAPGMSSWSARSTASPAWWSSRTV